MKATKDVVQEMYAQTPSGTRAAFEGDSKRALGYYHEFIHFVKKAIPAGNGPQQICLLDVGCGCGWSSFGFSQEGYVTTGLDLNTAAFEPPKTQGLTLIEGSATDIPLPDASFDAVVTYQCIEHVPDPEVVLKEMIRVCKPGGVICVVGPNLISPFLPVKYLALSVRRHEKLAWKRRGDTPRHPYGNTVSENFASIPVNILRLVRKIFTSSPTFLMRTPDTIPPFHADNDSCYLCNPTDFVKFFPKHNCSVFQVGKHGRPPLSYLFAGGTWIAARKN